jgi:hypothetical protein
MDQTLKPENETSVNSVNSATMPLETTILNQLLAKITNNKDFLVSINLTENEINIINLILKNHPELLNNICNDIYDIVKDNVINVNDIPRIILLLKDVINLYSTKNNLKIKKNDIIDFIKNILIILINSDIIKIDSENKILINNLIILSVQLLETNINIKLNKFCFLPVCCK